MLTRRNARQTQSAPAASTSMVDQPGNVGQFSPAQLTSPANKSIAISPGKVGSAAGSVGRDLGPVATGAIVAVLGGLAVVGVVAVRRYDPLAGTGATRVDVEVREVAQPPTPPKTEPAVDTESATDEGVPTEQSPDETGVESTDEPDNTADEAGASSPPARVDDEATGDSAGSPTAAGQSAADQKTGDGASSAGQAVAGSAASGQNGTGSPAPATGGSGAAGAAGSGSAGTSAGASSGEAGAGTPQVGDAPTRANPPTPQSPPVPVLPSPAPAPTTVEQPQASQPVLVAAPIDPVVFEGQLTAVIEWSLGGGAEPSGFLMSWSGGGRSEEETLAANARRNQLPNLIPGTPHTATIVPLGPEGSPRSESALTVSFRTLDVDVSPPRPAEDLAVSAGPDRLTVSWTSEIDDPGTTGYFVSWGCCGGRVGGQSVFPEDGQASFTIEGLQSGILYQIDILTLGANFVADPETSRRVAGTPE